MLCSYVLYVYMFEPNNVFKSVWFKLQIRRGRVEPQNKHGNTYQPGRQLRTAGRLWVQVHFHCTMTPRPAKRPRMASTRGQSSKNTSAGRCQKPLELRPNQQKESPLLSLPPEIFDEIVRVLIIHLPTESQCLCSNNIQLGDPVLSEREHIALSGTCTLLRLGYDETVWEVSSSTRIVRYLNAY